MIKILKAYFDRNSNSSMSSNSDQMMKAIVADHRQYRSTTSRVYPSHAQYLGGQEAWME